MFDIMPKQNKINCFFFINLSTLTYPQILTLLRDENLKTNYELRNMNFIVYGILMKIEMIFENIWTNEYSAVYPTCNSNAPYLKCSLFL